MLNLKDWMEIVDYRITEGSEYCWKCFGPNAYILDAWDGEHDGVSASIIFDTATQLVYQMTVYDYANEKAYRLMNPDYADAYRAELAALADKGIEDCAWDGVPYVDLEVDEDFKDKASAIMRYEEYDDRITVPLELDDDVAFQLMLEAHRRDITFNQLVEEALRLSIDEANRDPEGFKQRAQEFLNGKGLA